MGSALLQLPGFTTNPHLSRWGRGLLSQIVFRRVHETILQLVTELDLKAVVRQLPRALMSKRRIGQNRIQNKRRRQGAKPPEVS